MKLREPRWGDVAIASALMLLAVLTVVENDVLDQTDGRPYDALGWTLMALQVVPLVWRQDYPRVVVWASVLPLMVSVGLDYDDTAAGFAVYVALYSLAAYSDRRQALIHGGILLVLLVGWTTLGLFHTDFVAWTSLIAIALAVVLPMMLGFIDHRRRERITELELEHERRERAARGVAMDAVRAERARIARELHDVVAHEITVMTLQAEGARRLAKDSDERVLEALATISNSGRKGLTEMQRMIGVLRATEVDAIDVIERDRALADREPMPALAALPALARQVADAGLPVDIEIVGTSHVPAGVELSAYRVVQEALTNAMKHAGPGAQATVTVDRRPRQVVVTVEDDGRGVISDAASHSGGHGLRGMGERVHALGGTLEYGPRQGGGFRVRAVFPSSDDQALGSHHSTTEERR